MAHKIGKHFFLVAVICSLLAPAHVRAQTAAGAAESGIIRAPAFTTEELRALPRDNWIANGGNLFNQRFSQLDRINKTNVMDLQARWRVHLEGSGLDAKYSGEAQPIVYQGAIYISTGAANP